MATPEIVNNPRKQGEFLAQTNGNNPGKAASPSALFTGIPPGECARISAAARVREFARGEMLYIEGEPVDQVLLLTSGLAKINKLGSSGTEVILGLLSAGDVLGAIGLFSTARHCTTAQAFRPCRALVWDAATFKGLVDSFPVLHQNLLRITGEYVLELEERFHEVATEKVGPRVARQLVRLRNKIGRPTDGAVEISMSREDLAQMTGTTLFTVSRLLSAWEARGMLTSRREAVTILDVESLNAISGEKPFAKSSNKAVGFWGSTPTAGASPNREFF
jgi:CRP-like cAMP-binding protein